MKTFFNKKIIKRYTPLLAILFYFLTFINTCYSQILSSDTFNKIFDQGDAFRNKAGFENTDETGVAMVISQFILGFLGLLGIIFIVLLVIAGQKWMTAGGEEQKVNEAKDTIKRAIIGLIIVVSAYSITYFVFRNL